MKQIIILLVLIAAGFAVSMYLPINESGQNSSPLPSASVLVVPENWQTYASQSRGFSLRYDPQLEISETNESETRWFMLGPTQTGETELYDGILFSIRRNRGSMEAGIQARLEDFRNVGSITVPLHDLMVNGNPAKSFSASSLGDFTIIFIPTGDGFLEVAYIAPDPGNLGFQKTVDTMLSTFEIL